MALSGAELLSDAIERDREETRRIEASIEKLRDSDERVSSQAGYFLSLLDDPRSNRLVAEAQRAIVLARRELVPDTVKDGQGDEESLVLLEKPKEQLVASK